MDVDEACHKSFGNLVKMENISYGFVCVRLTVFFLKSISSKDYFGVPSISSSKTNKLQISSNKIKCFTRYLVLAKAL